MSPTGREARAPLARARAFLSKRRWVANLVQEVFDCFPRLQGALLRLARDLELIKEDVVFFAVTIEQRHALDWAR